ncbi:WhiB family transcriptional regulator [Nonomuraea sp. NPDC050310]|uniref:WhiB family transcriptional regulator n=1 Tax=Nonomuraea sp. NPDC050310 TaxID=3154935 RepID=UPI0033C96D5F
MTALWRDDAACRTAADFTVFFPQGERSPEVEQAVAFCRWCPVRAQCLAFALDNNEKDGIWGGLTPKERRRERRRQQRYPAKREVTVAKKKCRHCKDILPAADYDQRSNAPDGLNPVCRSCIRLRESALQEAS